MSPEQTKYLKKLKRTRLLILFLQITSILLFLTIWEYLSRNSFINSFIYSSPMKIIRCLKDLYNSNTLFIHIFCTLKEVLISFVSGTLIGFIIAMLLYEFKILFRFFEPFLITLNSLPKVALGPMIIIIAGANLKSIIIMALLINLIVTIINLYNGFINVEDNKIILLKSFKASKIEILYYLILPGSLNTIISTLKLNISMTLIGVIMGEFLVSKEGIGYLIIYGSQIFNMNLVMSGIVILIIISIIIYFLLNLIFNKYQK